MPKKLHRCANKVQKSGKSKSAAFAICNASISRKKAQKKKK